MAPVSGIIYKIQVYDIVIYIIITKRLELLFELSLYFYRKPSYTFLLKDFTSFFQTPSTVSNITKPRSWY